MLIEPRRHCKIHNRKDLMSEILKNFSIKTAKQKNKSFKYFVEKYQR
jgi:ribosomal protein L17